MPALAAKDVRELERNVPKGAVQVGGLVWRNQLEAARIKAGLSQKELSELSGVARRYIIGIELHNNQPSEHGQHQQKLADALGVPVGVLFWYESQ